MREPSTVDIRAAGSIRISKPVQYFESETDIFSTFVPQSYFNLEMLSYVSLNIYHENIMRIILSLEHFKPLLQLISKFQYFDIRFLLSSMPRF